MRNVYFTQTYITEIRSLLLDLEQLRGFYYHTWEELRHKSLTSEEFITCYELKLLFSHTEDPFILEGEFAEYVHNGILEVLAPNEKEDDE